MPAPLSRPLYPYRRGCWQVEDRGLEPKPDGKDLYLNYNTSLLNPLRVRLPLYAVNREARNVALKYIREQQLTAPQGSTDSGFEFLRHFDPRTDTMFLPTFDIETFLMEQIDRLSEPDVDGHYYSTTSPILPRLAVTALGFEILKGELESLIDTSAPIDLLYVVDVASDSTNTLDELEHAGKHIPLDIKDTDSARLFWRSSLREWEVTGNDQDLAWMRQLVTGLDDPRSSTSISDLEIRLVHVTACGMDSSLSS